MKWSTETYTQLTNALQDLNHGIQQKLLSMPFYTGQEMQSLERWLEETKGQAKNLESVLAIISNHLDYLEKEYRTKSLMSAFLMGIIFTVSYC